MKFTQRTIDSLTCPAGRKDALVFDDDQRGLGVRVTAGGGKTYLCQFTAAGQKRRVPLGACNAIALADARKAVQALLGQVATGADPAAERKAAAATARRKDAHDAFTLAVLLADWESLHLATKRPRYAVEALRALRTAFGQFLDLPAADIDRAMVVKVLDAMTRQGSAAMASRTAAYGKAAYGWAVKRGTIGANPFLALPVAPTERRDKVLADDELAVVWRAAEGAGVFGSIVRFLILTGQRREEVAGMAWAEVSDDLSTWTIPGTRAKNGTTHVVPLPAPAQALLRGLPRVGELVFPGRVGIFSGWSKSKADLDKAADVTGWRLHDLRRTLATGLQKLGVRLEVTEAVLNHTAGSRAGIVGVYQRHDYATEKRAALDAWGKHVLAVVEGRQAGDNVVAMPQRA